MNDTPEMIRQQMEATKLDLAQKMETLEQQVSETVHSTGTAVNATVGAVQETVESVTGAVQDAVQSVSNAFNLRRQASKHPWLVFGGSVALGYLAYGFLAGRRKKSDPPPVIVLETATGTLNDEKSLVDNAAATAIVAAYEAGREHSTSHRARSLAMDALIGIGQAVAIHAVPYVLEHFARKQSDTGASRGEGTGPQQEPRHRKESPDAAQRLRIASPENLRSGNSF